MALPLIGVCGCLLAIASGGAAATDHGVLVGTGLVALAFYGTAVAIYSRDPVLAFILLWLLLLFTPPLSTAVGYSSPTGAAIRQAAEVLVVLFVGLTAWRTMLTNIRLPPLRFILPGIGIALFGALGAVLHDVPFTVTIVGAWLGLKLWIMIGVTLLLPWKSSDFTRIYTVLTRVGLFVAALGIVDYLTHAAVSHVLHTSNFHLETGRGRSVSSILTAPGEFSLFMSMLFALTFTRVALKRSRSDLVLALLFAVSVVLSLRLKGFLSLAAVVVIVALVQSVVGNRRSISVLLASLLLLIGAFSLEESVVERQLYTYTATETPRSLLYKAGTQIANSNLPLGVGFGRFGSYASQTYYSPVYDQYGLSSVFGLSRTYPEAIVDASWASVIGETGYAGLICYVVGLVLVILALVRRLSTAAVATKWVPLAALCVIAVLLVTSAGQGSLFDWLAVTTFAMILGPALIATRPTLNTTVAMDTPASGRRSSQKPSQTLPTNRQPITQALPSTLRRAGRPR